MKIDRALMVEILNTVAPAIAKKGDEQMTNRVVFTGADVAGYTDYVSIIHPLVTDFTTACPFDELSRILKKYKGKEAEFIYSAGNINIKGGTKLKARLVTDPLHPHVEYIQNLIEIADGGLAWRPLPDDFLEGVKLCMYSASNDAGQGHLQCVYTNGDKIAASDDFRISEYTMLGAIEDKILIPATTCMEMVKLGTLTQYAIHETWAFFLTPDNVMLCARLFTEEYDDYTQFFGMPEDATSVTLPAKKLINEVETVSIMADGDLDIEKSIRVQMENGHITLSGEKAIGFVKTTISDKAVQINGQAVFGINPIFFADVLARTQTVDVTVDKALFTSDDHKFKHLISLSIA